MRMLKKRRYMMATKAVHKLGDMGRNKADICDIYGEEGEFYVGSWVVGLGFTDVKFPKTTTRDLTVEEKAKYNGQRIGIGRRVFLTIRIP